MIVFLFCFFFNEFIEKSRKLLFMWQYFLALTYFPCLHNKHRNTTFRCSSLVYGLCANLCFLIHRILKFQYPQLSILVNTKPNGNQKWNWDREKWKFCWLVTSLPMYLKSGSLRTDHRRVKNIESSVVLLRRQHLLCTFWTNMK